MNLGTAQVIQGDARQLPLADNTVDLVVTSPPYFALRSYQDGGEHYSGQLGSEGTPAEFVAALLEVTRECVRVLKPSGSLWVNLGDKYAGSPAGNAVPSGKHAGNTGALAQMSSAPRRPHPGVPTKSLMGLPWRYALACIDDLGLILRAEVIWSKPNGLPESVTDRVRRSHEQWFHFTLEPQYFSAVDEIRETYTAPPFKGQKKHTATSVGQTRNPSIGTWDASDYEHNPLGKLPGSVWTIPTQPLQVPNHLGVDHFAAYPTEWPRRIIQGWSPTGVCTACGEGRRPVADRESGGRERSTTSAKDPSWQAINRADWQENVTRIITGYACACPQPTAPTRPAVVLDPFGGTGTTALVAKALGRHGITIDMSADYSRLAEWRTNDRNSLAKVLGITKTDAPDVEQLDLFGEATA